MYWLVDVQVLQLYRVPGWQADRLQVVERIYRFRG